MKKHRMSTVKMGFIYSSRGQDRQIHENDDNDDDDKLCKTVVVRYLLELDYIT